MVVRAAVDQGALSAFFGRRVASVRRAGAVAALASLASAGCSSSEPAEDADAGTELAAEVTCSADPRATTYLPNLERPAKGGAFVATLVVATPAPPAKGLNAWTLRLTRDGAPLDGATVEVVPFMPDHGHGAVRAPVITARGGGEYAVADIALAMTGVWEVTVKVTAPVTDEATFSFCIPG